MKNKTDRGKDNLVKKLKLQCKKVQSNKSLKNAHGITLVALVITIIIIIILASITMNMAFGDNGLIKQAQKAKDMAANSVIAEQEGMNSLMGEFANTMGNEIDNPTDPDPDEPDPEPGPGEEIPEGTITFGEVVWSGYRASVSVSSSAVNSNGISTSETSSNEENSTEAKYTIQYQINGQVDNQWKTINNGESVENLYHGDKVYARLTDGEKASQPQEKQILDTKAPAKAVIELNKESLTAGDTLTAKVTHIDNESGVDLAQSKWIMNQTASEIGTETENYTGTFSSNGETINLDSKTTGEYYLHILTVDKGGNKTETISNKITIGNITGTVHQKGETTWSGGHASIELETTETGFTIEYKINNGSWTSYSGAIGNLNHGDKVTARLTNGTVAGPETTIEIKDENNPVVIVTAGGTTTNSVTVSVSASDNESGMADNVTYTYYIKKTSEGNGSYNAPNGATNISQTNYTFTNLEQGTGYDVKVEAKADKAGNIGTGNLLNQETATIGGASEGLEKGNIVAGPVTWSGGKASTTLTTDTGLKIQYQINTTTEGNWKTISSGGTVGNLNHGDTVFARLYDGKNHGDYASVNILDGIPPTVQISVGEITKNSIAVSVTANDGQSGLATSNTYKYYLNSELKQTTTETSYTFEGLTTETSYEIKVEAYDKANNKGTDTENVETAGIPTIPESTSYVGCYADVDGNGSVDGVIYADLAIGGSGQWYNENGAYTIPKGSGFKKYTVSGSHTESGFGTKDVIKVANESGNKRFYVMALSNVSGRESWYDKAAGNMNDYSTATSGEFGTGEKNTQTMISKWNSEAYGSQNSGDMWGLSTIQSGTLNGLEGWYVPSKGEWAAFGAAFGIKESNYSAYGLSYNYWSSSQYNSREVWYANFNVGRMMTTSVDGSGSSYVRLSTTF